MVIINMAITEFEGNCFTYGFRLYEFNSCNFGAACTGNEWETACEITFPNELFLKRELPQCVLYWVNNTSAKITQRVTTDQWRIRANR